MFIKCKNNNNQVLISLDMHLNASACDHLKIIRN